MRVLFYSTILFVVFFGTSGHAYQNAMDVNVTGTQIDYSRHICTFQIQQKHPVTSQTVKCNQQKFSWQCLDNHDYRYEMAENCQKNGSQMDIRFSEYSCDPLTNNMLLLTVW